MNRKLIIFSSLCVILLLAMVGGTLAWFYVNEEVTVSYGNSIFCEAGDSLEIALVEGDVTGKWTGAIDYRPVDLFTIVDISGDGSHLYRPTEINEEQQPVSMIEAASSRDYVEMKVKFRSVSKMNVYLSEESFILPVDPNNTPNEFGNTNIYGDFSRDYIAGAMRVAVLDENGELIMLWAPNSQYQLIQNPNGTYNFKTGENGNSTPETEYYFYGEDENGNVVQQTVTADMYAAKQFVVDSTGANKGDSGNSPVLVSLDPESVGAYAEQTVIIRVWFEGTDREAHQALAGGNVNVKLKFVGISKETNETMQTVINHITAVEEITEGMVFSTDGRNWTQYDPQTTNLPVLEAGSSIYIKYPETTTQYETTCKKLTIPPND